MARDPKLLKLLTDLYLAGATNSSGGINKQVLGRAAKSGLVRNPRGAVDITEAGVIYLSCNPTPELIEHMTGHRPTPLWITVEGHEGETLTELLGRPARPVQFPPGFVERARHALTRALQGRAVTPDRTRKILENKGWLSVDAAVTPAGIEACCQEPLVCEALASLVLGCAVTPAWKHNGVVYDTLTDITRGAKL